MTSHTVAALLHSDTQFAPAKWTRHGLRSDAIACLTANRLEISNPGRCSHSAFAETRFPFSFSVLCCRCASTWGCGRRRKSTWTKIPGHGRTASEETLGPEQLWAAPCKAPHFTAAGDSSVWQGDPCCSGQYTGCSLPIASSCCLSKPQSKRSSNGSISEFWFTVCVIFVYLIQQLSVELRWHLHHHHHARQEPARW